MSTLFTKIIEGTIPCHKIAEDEYSIAFLDIFPLRRGHTLVVPKTEVDIWYHQQSVVLHRLMDMAKLVAPAIEKSFPCNRIGLSIIGIEVPHTHIHLVPISSAQDINFNQPKLQLTSEELEATALLIKSNL